MSVPVWDLEVSHSRGLLILRRRRPDLGPTIEEVRTYPLAVVVEALTATNIHQEAREREAVTA